MGAALSFLIIIAIINNKIIRYTKSHPNKRMALFSINVNCAFVESPVAIKYNICVLSLDFICKDKDKYGKEY